MQNTDFTRSRFEHYCHKLAEFGIKRGIVLKSIEESLRKDIISILSFSNTKNTVIANIIGKNEKTVRNLKRKFAGKGVILKKNRTFLINTIVYDLTHQNKNWISINTIFDRYLESNEDDIEFDEKVMRETLNLLVKNGHIIEQRQKYTAFYRTASEEPVGILREKSNREKYKTVLAIAQEFDNMVDYLGQHPDMMQEIKFSETTGFCLPQVTIEEINNKVRQYAAQLVHDYEQQLLDHGNDIKEGVEFRIIVGIAPVKLGKKEE